MLVRRALVERELLERVALRVLERGLRGGHAVHRRYRWGATTVRYPRWCDAHVALGLVDAAATLLGRDDLAPTAPLACRSSAKKSIRPRPRSGGEAGRSVLARAAGADGRALGNVAETAADLGRHFDQVADSREWKARRRACAVDRSSHFPPTWSRTHSTLELGRALGKPRRRLPPLVGA